MEITIANLSSYIKNQVYFIFMIIQLLLVGKNHRKMKSKHFISWLGWSLMHYLEHYV